LVRAPAGMCFGSLFLFSVLGHIPNGVIYGLLAYMGVSGFFGVELVARAWLLLTEKKLQPKYDYMDKVPFALIRWYTLLQLLCVIVIFVVATFTGVVANVFPVLLAALVLIRRYLLPTLFPDRDLKCLDRDGDETEADLGINVHQNSIRQSLEASILTRSSPRNTHSYGVRASTRSSGSCPHSSTSHAHASHRSDASQRSVSISRQSSAAAHHSSVRVSIGGSNRTSQLQEHLLEEGDKAQAHLPLRVPSRSSGAVVAPLIAPRPNTPLSSSPPTGTPPVGTPPAGGPPPGEVRASFHVQLVRKSSASSHASHTTSVGSRDSAPAVPPANDAERPGACADAAPAPPGA